MAPSQLASRAFTALVTASPSSTTVASTSLALAASSRPASLLGFAASAAAATAAVSFVSSSTAPPDTSLSTPSSALQSILSGLGLVSVAHCLELRDPATSKLYNVEAATYSSQIMFIPMAVGDRTTGKRALNLVLNFALDLALQALVDLAWKPLCVATCSTWKACSRIYRGGTSQKARAEADGQGDGPAGGGGDEGGGAVAPTDATAAVVAGAAAALPPVARREAFEPWCHFIFAVAVRAGSTMCGRTVMVALMGLLRIRPVWVKLLTTKVCVSLLQKLLSRTSGSSDRRLLSPNSVSSNELIMRRRIVSSLAGDILGIQAANAVIAKLGLR